MKRFLLIILIVTLFVSLSSHKDTQPPQAPVATLSVSELEADTNAYRTEKQLPVLELDEKLSLASEQKCKDMSLRNYWAHSINGESFDTQIRNQGFSGAVGENLSKGFEDSDEIIKAWSESPSHRENLEKPWRLVGFATCTYATGQVIVVQSFSE